MLSNKSLITVVLVFALVLSFGLVFWSYNSASAHGSRGKDDVDDVDEVKVENLPASLGKFQLKGVITAVNVSSSQISVNGLSLNVAADGKIRKGDLKTLGDLAVDDRVEISGRIENGIITADKIRIQAIKKAPQGAIGTASGTASGTVSGDVAKLRTDLQNRIADILKKIQELQNRINKQLPAPSSGGQATSTP